MPLTTITAWEALYDRSLHSDTIRSNTAPPGTLTSNDTPPEYIMRHKIEVVIKDEQVEQLISKLRERLRDEPQGGKIFVTDVPIAVDVTSNKRGEDAI